MLHSASAHLVQSFGSACKTGLLPALPGLRSGRLALYRELVFNNIIDGLANAFPLTQALLSQKEWNGLTQRFFASWDCTPYAYWQMSGELPKYAALAEAGLRKKYPWLLDLLNFEWSEIAVYMMEDIPLPEADQSGSLLRDRLCINPHLRLLQVAYPVHVQAPGTITKEDKGQYHVLIYRDPETLTAEFMALSPFYAGLLENLIPGEQSARQILMAIAAQSGHHYRLLAGNAKAFLKQLHKNNVIQGFYHEDNN
jgi:hypothetical protein